MPKINIQKGGAIMKFLIICIFFVLVAQSSPAGPVATPPDQPHLNAVADGADQRETPLGLYIRV